VASCHIQVRLMVGMKAFGWVMIMVFSCLGTLEAFGSLLILFLKVLGCEFETIECYYFWPFAVFKLV